MKREIKFRAWDKDGLTYWDGKSKDWKPQMIYKVDESSWWTWCKNNLIIMQFTGLHDKNGKEIYEGDLIKYTGISSCYRNYHHPNDTIYEIEKSLNRFVGRPVELKRDPEYCGGGELEDFLLSEDKEIVGNIYENPELINCQ